VDPSGRNLATAARSGYHDNESRTVATDLAGDWQTGRLSYSYGE
jgi:hypothetical protein